MLHLYHFICVVAVKVEVLKPGDNWFSTRLVRALNNLQDKTSHRPLETHILISRLKNNGIEILNSFDQLRHTDVWIWCKSQTGLDFLQDLYKTHRLTRVLANLSDMQSIKAIKLYIDMDQFKKEIGKFLNTCFIQHLLNFSGKCLVSLAQTCVIFSWVSGKDLKSLLGICRWWQK